MKIRSQTPIKKTSVNQKERVFSSHSNKLSFYPLEKRLFFGGSHKLKLMWASFCEVVHSNMFLRSNKMHRTLLYDTKIRVCQMLKQTPLIFKMHENWESYYKFSIQREKCTLKIRPTQKQNDNVFLKSIFEPASHPLFTA